MRNKNKKDPSGRNSILRALSRINPHVMLVITLIVILLSIVVIAANKIINWGHFVDPDELLKGEKKEYVDNFDSILPLMDKDGMPVYPDDKELTIVCFGNAPFADDRGSDDNLAFMIADMTGAAVYNCSIADGYMASQPYDDTNKPINNFNFYWLCHLAAGSSVDQSYQRALEILGEDAPVEAREVYDTVKAIDFSTVDVITIMYDASDYLDGHIVFDEENRTNIDTFTGSLEAGIQLLKDTYPHIRIIVLSPPYAYSDRLDENGNYISSELQFYSPAESGLYNYVLSQCISCGRNNVTFVDLYSTITGANADQYLTDHLHLNRDGRKKTAERFIYALEYYNRHDDKEE